ncbi:MAG TPA: hypothetical protein VGW34_13415 [Allosphingosinicella sp.]|nr:hypothetical protein [Allosphingosinicella sp.]
MIDWEALALLLASLGGGGAPSAHEPIQFAQLTVRRQIIVRVPVRVGTTPPKMPPVEWEEKGGPSCVPAKLIVGAALLGQNSVDLLLRDNSRIRAKLERSCPALDYYYGFYISPNEDGQICADRDAIRSRMGGQCEIERFRSLKAKRGD